MTNETKLEARFGSNFLLGCIPGDSMDTFWLIELRPAHNETSGFLPTSYYAGYMASPIAAAETTDPHAAPKWTRRQDANTVAAALKGAHTLNGIWTPVEHSFERPNAR